MAGVFTTSGTQFILVISNVVLSITGVVYLVVIAKYSSNSVLWFFTIVLTSASVFAEVNNASTFSLATRIISSLRRLILLPNIGAAHAVAISFSFCVFSQSMALDMMLILFCVE